MCQLSSDSSGTILVFCILLLVSGGTGLIAAFSKSIVRAAFSLFFCLGSISGVYVLLGSGFLAISQVVVYVGGILVLLVFGILLTGSDEEQEEQLSNFSKLTFPLSAILLAALIGLIASLPSTRDSGEVFTGEVDYSVSALGRELLTAHLPTLIIIGMALLLCLVGAAYLVRSESESLGEGPLQPEKKR